MRLRRQVDQERQSWYLLLICCGFFGLGSLGLVLGAFGSVAVFPVSMLSIAALVYFGERNYKRLLQQSLQDMLYGPMLLVVMDEAFGRSIEEQRRERYRPVMRQVPLGDGLLERINHSAHYYKQYWRACNGLMEQPVPGLSQLSCFQDGLLIGFASCSAIFLLGLPLLVFSVIRLLDVWPRTLAVKQALLEILDGRHEAELEQIYAYQQLRRSQVAAKNEPPQTLQ